MKTETVLYTYTRSSIDFVMQKCFEYNEAVNGVVFVEISVCQLDCDLSVTVHLFSVLLRQFLVKQIGFDDVFYLFYFCVYVRTVGCVYVYFSRTVGFGYLYVVGVVVEYTAVLRFLLNLYSIHQNPMFQYHGQRDHPTTLN